MYKMKMGLTLGLFAVMVCVPVFAQQAPAPAPATKAAPAPEQKAAPAPPMAPEQATKAWAIEAKTVAQTLSLNDEQTKKLQDAYKAARESYQTAVAAKMGEGEQARRDFSALREVTQAERAKLETAIKGFLTPEQTEKAIAYLGTFNRRWDKMTVALDSMNLDEKKQAEAMKLVADYNVESAKMMSAAAEGNRENMREQAMKMREKLNADMAKILTPEQMTKWTELTARRGRAARPE